MNTCKLIFRNVCKNIRDYLIYFLTLTLSVSLFYAFNSISDQPAFSNMGMTGTLLYRQLGIMLSTLSTMIAVVLAFLILYANQFLLKRRKKELGVYMMLGMKKGRISRLFAGETLCVGVIALGTGLLLGFFFSQGFSLIALRLFAINLEKFRIVFSAGALRQTVLCFAIIFFIVMLFNIRSVTNVKLIDLLTDSRKNESMQTENRILPVCLFLLSLLCIGISAALFNKNGILPSHENNLFQLAAAALIAGTFLLFYSLSAVFMQAASARKCFYLKGLNTFLVRQIGSKIRTNYLVVTVVCGLLTITICAVSIGASTALAMNKMSRSATPYDLNVLSNVSVDGDSDIAAYLAAHDITISNYAKATEQISVYEADITYSELFEGQKVKFWPIDEKVPDSKVSVISISDLNRALAMQNKAPITLNDGQYLLNCNYNGTYTPHPNMLFSNYLEFWLQWKRKSWEEVTYSGYCQNVRSWIAPYFSARKVRLNEITVLDIEMFYTHEINKRGVSGNTVLHYHANIRKALSDAVKLKLIPYNPAAEVERPKKDNFVASYYSADELMEVLPIFANTKMELPVMLAAFYGLRRSEVIGLQWSAIDFERKIVTISRTFERINVDGKMVDVSKCRTKNKSSFRSLPLIPAVEQALLKAQKRQRQQMKLCGNSYCKEYKDYICVDDMGHLVTPDYVTRVFREMLLKNGFRPIRYHDLRHSCASLLIKNKVTMKEVQMWLGHSSFSTTANIYAHIDVDSKMEAANMIASKINLGELPEKKKSPKRKIA